MIRENEIGIQREKIIQGVRDKCAAASEQWPIEHLATVKIHKNVEVCALLDEIDQLNRIVQASIDCEDERVVSGSNRVSTGMWGRVVKLLCENGYRLVKKP